MWLSSPVYKGSLMMVQYPKLHKMAPAISFWTFSLLPKDLASILPQTYLRAFEGANLGVRYSNLVGAQIFDIPTQ